MIFLLGQSGVGGPPMPETGVARSIWGGRAAHGTIKIALNSGVQEIRWL